MERIEARIVAGVVPGLALALAPVLVPAPGQVAGPAALVDQEASRVTTTAAVPAPPPIAVASPLELKRAGALALRLLGVSTRARVGGSDRLWRFEWAPRPGGRLDAAFRAGEAELDERCPRDDLDCWRERHRPGEALLDTLRRDPRTDAGAAGVLVARTAVRWSPGTQVATLGLDLAFRPTDEEDPTVLRPLGDWSYGVSFHVPSRRGSWVPIPGTDGWLDTAAGRVRGEVKSAEGRLVTLEAAVPGERVTAGDEGPRSEREIRVEPGGYLVTRTGDGAVWLREERPADFELRCRGISDTAAAGAGGRADPELFRVAIPDLYRSGDGTPLLQDSYPRGC